MTLLVCVLGIICLGLSFNAIADTKTLTARWDDPIVYAGFVLGLAGSFLIGFGFWIHIHK